MYEYNQEFKLLRLKIKDSFISMNPNQDALSYLSESSKRILILEMCRFTSLSEILQLMEIDSLTMHYKPASVGLRMTWYS